MAGAVREAAWTVALADAARRQAQAAHAAAATLADSIARRAAAGDLARLDTLLAQAETAARAAELQAAKAAYDQALTAWVALTGQTDLPAPLLEPAPELSQPLTLPEDHPLLAHATADLAWADAERQRVSADRRGHPLLGVGARQTRDARGAGTDEALQLELNRPFGSRRQSAPAQASAEQAYTERLTAAHQTRLEAARTLALALAAAQDDRARLAAAQQRVAVAGEAADLTRRAFSLGEGELATLLQTEARAAEARLALELTRLEQGRDIARLQQALGVLPP
jgi:outer membrane protein TolC